MTEHDRELIIATIRNYEALLEDRGLSLPIPDDLASMELGELRKLERRCKELARTPN